MEVIYSCIMHPILPEKNVSAPKETFYLVPETICHILNLDFWIPNHLDILHCLYRVVAEDTTTALLTPVAYC